MKKYIFGLFVLFITPALAEDTGISEKISEAFAYFGEGMKSTWYDGKIQIMAPINTWHNRLTYSHKKIKKYNERPWGAGIGKYRYDNKGYRHGLMAFTFQDSFDKPEPTLGYTWQAVWRKDEFFRPTLGFLAGITFKKKYHWIPIPGISPTFGFDLGPVSLENLYIPGYDVLFSWITYRF